MPQNDEDLSDHNSSNNDLSTDNKDAAAANNDSVDSNSNNNNNKRGINHDNNTMAKMVQKKGRCRRGKEGNDVNQISVPYEYLLWARPAKARR